ncbi:MAG: insulinase family protein [Ignavibacteria bacterium]|nr:insulinase family protein [Ignavibacteria bacterium]
MKKLIAILVVAIVLSSLQGFAQIDRSKKPNPGPAPKASFPDYSETTLPNGLKVLIVENHAQPVVTFRLMIKSGSEFDAGKSGTASFVSDLLTKGTKNRTSLQFAQEADNLGVSVGASAADDFMSVGAGGLKKHMTKILDLMTDALFNPTFPQEELEKTQKQTISGLVSERKSPEAVANRLQITVGFNVHPYSMFPTEESVKSITREDLVSFHSKYYIPNNASLAIVGDVTTADIKPIIRKYFENWKKGTPPKAEFSAPKPLMEPAVHMVDLGASQTQTALAILSSGMKRGDPDWVTFGMLNSILGGGFSGRLFQNLRETHSFTYGAYSEMDGRKAAGMWSASANVRRIATDSAATEILHEMDRLTTELVKDEELDMHKQYASGRFLLSLENPGAMATRVQDIDLYGLPKDYYKTYISRVMAITPADLQRVAKKYLSTKHIAISAVGDAASITDQLKKFGPVKMYDPEMKPVEAAVVSKADIDAETLLERHITALGGRAKLEAIKDRTLEGNLSMNFSGQSIEGTLLEIKKAPNKDYQKTSISFQGQVIEQEKWNDGTTVTSILPQQPAPTTMSGDELAQELEKDLFNDVLRYKELGFTPTVVSRKALGAKQVYVLEMKKKHGSNTLLIDASTWLLAGEETTIKGPQGEQAITVLYDDYKAVDGVMLPHKMTTDAGMMTQEMTVTSYKHNTNVSDEIFKAR